jgi:hypothetical protein
MKLNLAQDQLGVSELGPPVVDNEPLSDVCTLKLGCDNGSEIVCRLSDIRFAKEIGRGAFGRVFKAVAPATMAVKV